MGNNLPHIKYQSRIGIEHSRPKESRKGKKKLIIENQIKQQQALMEAYQLTPFVKCARKKHELLKQQASQSKLHIMQNWNTVNKEISIYRGISMEGKYDAEFQHTSKDNSFFKRQANGLHIPVRLGKHNQSTVEDPGYLVSDFTPVLIDGKTTPIIPTTTIKVHNRRNIQSSKQTRGSIENRNETECAAFNEQRKYAISSHSKRLDTSQMCRVNYNKSVR